MIGSVLIIDDEAGSLKLLKDILTNECHHVRAFNNGELALRSVELEAPDVILLDIRMPEMNGLEVCRQLKEKQHLKNIPVIFISGASDVEDKISAFQAGGVDYITKPFQKEEVVARVKTHVALSQTLQELKRIAAALDKSEKSLKMAQSIAQLGHWEWNLDTGEFYWSEEMFHIFGYDTQNVSCCYETFLQCVHQDDRESVEQLLEQALVGKNFETECRICLPNQQVRIVHIKGDMVKQQPRIIETMQYLSAQDEITMIGVMQDITERKKLEFELKQQANTDALTGCASRRHFAECANQEFLRIQRYGGDLSVLMFDLDFFKTINDKYGHQSGDTVLKHFVRICSSMLRDVDLMGRVGGEEFAAILPETGGMQAMEVAKRLCQSVANTPIVLDGYEAIHFTVSIGVSSLLKSDNQFDTILNRADKALYQAKQNGRNCVVDSGIL